MECVYATINGLPQATINITIDGINVQDNSTKSNPDAVFNAVQLAPRPSKR